MQWKAPTGFCKIVRALSSPSSTRMALSMASIVRCFVALAFLLVLFNVTMVDLPAIAVQSPSEHGQHQAIDEPESPADDMGLQLTPEDQSESPNGAQREDQNFIVTLQALETVVGGDEGESVDPKPVKDGTPDDGEPEEVEADVEAHESQMSVEDKGEEQEGNNDVGGWFPDKDTEEGEGGADGGDETDKADWERFKEQQQALSPRHGRDQSKFPFDRDEPADTGVLKHLVWAEHVPVLLHKACQYPESRIRLDGMLFFSNVFIPDEPRSGHNGLPVGGCGRQIKELPGVKDGAVPPGMERLTFRISANAYKSLPDNDIPQRKAAKRWRACAVVGNSGVMLAQKLGADIDKHDMVLRMNNAPLARQFQPHVGSKTTISLMNQHHGKLIAGRVPLKHKNAIVTLYESAHPHVRNEIYPNIRSRFRNAQLLSPAFLVRAYSTWFKLKSIVEEQRMAQSFEQNSTYREMKRKPMSGFFAALFALQVCQHVDLYGFAAWTKGTWEKDHTPYQLRPVCSSHCSPKGCSSSLPIPDSPSDFPCAPCSYFDGVSGVTAVHSFPLAFKIFQLMGKHANLTVLV